MRLNLSRTEARGEECGEEEGLHGSPRGSARSCGSTLFRYEGPRR